MSLTETPLLPGRYYHIYNRGIDSRPIFTDDKCYIRFIQLLCKHLPPRLEMFSYCILSTHFHLVIRVNENCSVKPHLALSHACNAYSQSFNKRFQSTGSLFERPFKRKEIQSVEYLWRIIRYINLNPDHHNIGSYPTYPWSSYRSLISQDPTILNKDEVLALFDGKEGLIDALHQGADLQKIRDYILENNHE